LLAPRYPDFRRDLSVRPACPAPVVEIQNAWRDARDLGRFATLSTVHVDRRHRVHGDVGAELSPASAGVFAWRGAADAHTGCTDRGHVRRERAGLTASRDASR